MAHQHQFVTLKIIYKSTNQSHKRPVSGQPNTAQLTHPANLPSILFNVQKHQHNTPSFHDTLTLTTQMPLSLSPPILTALLLLLLLFSTLLMPSSSATFPNCHRNFTCGSLQNITYPFTGGERPHYCGPPEFHLTCRYNTYAELTTDSVTYRVLQINQTEQTLVLARSDLWNNTCPHRLVNSTLNSSVFSYGVGNEELTLFYGCNPLKNYTSHNQFSCAVSGINVTDAFYLVGPVPLDPVLQLITVCHVDVTVPVIGDAAGRLTGGQATLAETLMEGFNVNYSNQYATQCLNCTYFGNQCGFDSNLSLPICICDGDLPCPVRIVLLGSNSSKPSSTNTALIIISAVLAGIGLGWGIFACTQRKKRIAAQSSISAAAKSKDIPSPTLSKGLITPSASFSHSIPSYPFPSIEFGKASTYFGAQVFSYTELEEATNNFDPSRELGDGGFGTVYYGKLQDGRVVAVKRLYENNFKRVEQFMNEVEILTRLRHENLVALYGCTSKRSRELLLVYEYIPNGTVGDHLHGKRANSGLLSWPVRLSIATETAVALAYLHASDIIHRDVKTNNILLDNNFRVKVADFGLSRLFPNNVTHVSTAPQGTPGYVDPEYYQCYQLTEKSDVYSFGVVLIELISSKQAVDTNRSRQDINLSNMAMKKIQNRALHELVDPSLGFETNSSVRRMTTLVAELAFQCLQTDREMRPSMQEVLEALRKIRNEDLNVQKAEVVDILKGNFPLMSPDLEAAEKWASNSTTPSSSG
ncbi:LEAF RUST 10 DISEASE-RESISTANCE LOCUS RECEPTOR-LIKE PROTEIN KINASE-like 1.4 isoform X1 [Camellia sinensis]|nr:LEAF RUST 10 DISEASE-RESISTANCE LOCUS RECEPTOR-LIKE PROTEIN KINASE-like 1.4 isoform X1 [Camellia sinensis]